jgi:NAD(P)-dependent dehydrogenase (short-subunit alcohol dehydrogenase family)
MTQPVLLIAAGSGGIGAATARLAGARGSDVAVNYKGNAKAAASVFDAVKAADGKAVAIPGDMAIEQDAEGVFGAAVAQLGALSHFVHSAGIGCKNSRLEAASAATLREVINVNLHGGLLCAREAVRSMSTAKGGRGGSIVLLSSICGPRLLIGVLGWTAPNGIDCARKRSL